MYVQDIMTPHVDMVRSDQTLREAAKALARHGTGALPVHREGAMPGIVTDRDLVVRGLAGGLDPDRATVAECMTEGIEVCFEDEHIEDAAAKMERYGVRRLLVCDRDERPVGIVSLGDLAARAHARTLSGEVLEQVAEGGGTGAH